MDAQHTQRRHVIIGIMGSGKASAHDQPAQRIGRLVAEGGYMLLTGGGAGVDGATPPSPIQLTLVAVLP